MKMSSIKNTISTYVRNNNYRREQRFLDNYVNIHNNTTYGDSYQQMMSARKTIANYLRDKGVAIDIYDARQMLGEHDSPVIEDKLSDELWVEATDLLTNKHLAKVVSAKTDKVHIHTVSDYIVVNNVQDGVQQTRLTSHKFEDNFIRNLYRNIEELVKKVQN